MKIKNHGPKISKSQLDLLEKDLGVVLPNVYRGFLLIFNGGYPKPDIIDVPGLSESPTDVNVFYGLERSYESECINWQMKTLSERLEKGLMPIAGDSCGNVFCISLRNTDYGIVYYCDLQSVFADFESKPEFYPIASSFESFLENLHYI